MAKNGKLRSGDRYDGRLLRNLDIFRLLLPYYVCRRTEAQKRYEHRFEVSTAAKWIEKQREAGYEKMSFLHMFIAIFVRCCAYLPGINRFIVGRKLYAHDTVDVVLMTRLKNSVDGEEVPLKVSFDRNDTVYDVYRKINIAVEKAETDEKGTRTEQLAGAVFKKSSLVTRIIAWLIKKADLLGKLPPQVLAASPFHGSVTVSDNGPIGIASSYNDLHDFGTVPISVSMGRAHIVGDRKILDMKFTLDGRTVGMDSYASMLGAIQKIFDMPEELEITPSKIVNDEY